MLPSALFVPPIIYRCLILSVILGSFLIAIAMLVNGAIARSETSPGFSMSELRNAYGDGHGKTKSFKSLSSRYARLAVGAAITVVYFLWETYEERKTDF